MRGAHGDRARTPFLPRARRAGARPDRPRRVGRVVQQPRRTREMPAFRGGLGAIEQGRTCPLEVAPRDRMPSRGKCHLRREERERRQSHQVVHRRVGARRIAEQGGSDHQPDEGRPAEARDTRRRRRSPGPARTRCAALVAAPATICARPCTRLNQNWTSGRRRLVATSYPLVAAAIASSSRPASVSTSARGDVVGLRRGDAREELGPADHGPPGRAWRARRQCDRRRPTPSTYDTAAPMRVVTSSLCAGRLQQRQCASRLARVDEHRSHLVSRRGGRRRTSAALVAHRDEAGERDVAPGPPQRWIVARVSASSVRRYDVRG